MALQSPPSPGKPEFGTGGTGGSGGSGVKGHSILQGKPVGNPPGRRRSSPAPALFSSPGTRLRLTTKSVTTTEVVPKLSPRAISIPTRKQPCNSEKPCIGQEKVNKSVRIPLSPAPVA